MSALCNVMSSGYEVLCGFAPCIQKISAFFVGNQAVIFKLHHPQKFCSIIEKVLACPDFFGQFLYEAVDFLLASGC